MNINKMTVLIKNTIEKELRNRVFFILMVLTIISIGATAVGLKILFSEYLQPEMVAMVGDKTVEILSTFIYFWSGIIAIVFGLTCVRSDSEEKILDQILSFSIKRWEYLLARIIGAWLLVVFYFLFSYLLTLLAFTFIGHDFSLSLSFLEALGIVSLDLFGLILLGVLVSNFFSGIIGFVIISGLNMMIYMSNSYVNTILKNGGSLFENLSFFKMLGLTIHYIFPPLGTLTNLSRDAILGGEGFQMKDIAVLPHYLLSVIGLFIIFSYFFSKKDIT